MRKKHLALVLALVMAVIAMTGCGNKEETVGVEELKEITTTDTYPQKTDETLRHWGPISGSILSSYTNYGQSEAAKWMEEATGIHVEYEHPVTGQENAAFNIMINSDDMPDMISWQWTTHPGGPDKAIEEGIIAPLNEYYEKVSPNLTKLLDEHPDWRKMLMTDNGYYYQYPLLKEDEKLLTYTSLFIRSDLLKRAGLQEPVTLADWEEVLYTFKDMGVEVPLSVRITNGNLALFGAFMGCFGIMGDFYQEDGVIKFGPYEPAFKEYITLLNKWYKDGILDKDFADVDNKRRNALAVNGKCGAIEGSVSGNLGTWLTSIDPSSGIEFAATSVAVMNEGDTPMWTQATQPVMNAVAISASSDKKELAARWLDYSYSEEGHLLSNYGKEGVTYTMEESNGRTIPTFMSWMRNPAENGGLSFSECLEKYVKSSGAYMQSKDYIEQVYQHPAQKDAFKKFKSDVLKYKLPVTYLTDEEQKTYTDIMTPLNTYREETIAKIISGKLPLSELDNYFKKLKEMGIEEVIKIKQASYDRYLAR